MDNDSRASRIRRSHVHHVERKRVQDRAQRHPNASRVGVEQSGKALARSSALLSRKRSTSNRWLLFALTRKGNYDSVSQFLDITPSGGIDAEPFRESRGLITQGSLCSQTSSVVGASDSSEEADRLPIWNWSSDSCGLNSGLTIAFRLVLHDLDGLLFETATENERNDCFRALVDYADEWFKRDRNWGNWSAASLSTARDVIGEIVRAAGDEAIGQNSSASEIVRKLMPNFLFRPRIDYDIRCGSCGKDFVHTMSSDMLSFMGMSQRNSDTQAIVDRMVDPLVV